MKSFLERFRTRTQTTHDSRDKRPGRSIEELSALVAQRPSEWSLENDLADALIAAGRVDDAVTRLCATGDRLAQEHFTAQALALYRKALRLRPRNEYAAQRVAAMSAERISQTGFRLPAGMPGLHAAAVAEIEPAALPEPVDAIAPSTETSEPEETIEARANTVDDQPQPIEAEAEPVQPADEPPAALDKTVEEIVSEADFAAMYGGVNTAVKMLIECARMHPDRIEPVAKLVDVADLARLEDVWVDAQARLADFQCRRGDFESARRTAESLVARYPDDRRHRSRLELIIGELGEPAPANQTSSEESEPADPDALLDADFHRAMEVMVGFGDVASERELADARAVIERAATVARHHVAASRQLAVVDAQRGDWTSAMRWLEYAASGPLSATDEEELAYEMAVLLEQAGEWDRALGVFSEIAANVGPQYRDVSERILRLSSTSAAASRPVEQLAVS